MKNISDGVEKGFRYVNISTFANESDDFSMKSIAKLRDHTQWITATMTSDLSKNFDIQSLENKYKVVELLV